MEEFNENDVHIEEFDVCDPKKLKCKAQVPQFVETIPDFSGGRYITDEFKPPSRASKPAPFEVFDPTTYSSVAHCACFSTTTSRLPLWVKTLQLRYLEFLPSSGSYFVKWQEKNASFSEDKCERLVVQVYSRAESTISNVLIFAITIYLTTGRIQVQGNFWQQFGNKEMPLLPAIVNKLQEDGQVEQLQSQEFFCGVEDDQLPDDENKEIRNQDNSNVRNKRPAKKSNEKEMGEEINRSVPNTAANGAHTCNKLAEQETSFYNSSDNFGKESTLSPSRMNSLTAVKESLTSLERDMVDIRLELDHTACSDDVSDMKDKFKQLENSIKANNQKYEREIENLTEENSTLKKDLDEIRKTCKNYRIVKIHFLNKLNHC